jgi:lysophospholipase L1-like esterase
MRLVTLGDSYTAGSGTDVPQRDSWPAQLAESLRRGDMRLWVSNLARSGYTSGQVVEDQLGQVAAYEPDLVTLQIGANDILYEETAWYRGNLATIFDELLTILPPERIFAITMPDHTLTDWGRYYGPPEESRAAVAELNETLAQVAGERGIEVIDISLVNELVTTDPSLVIKAEPPVPYPTAKQYAGWVEIIGPRIHRALASIEP